ncbi:sensor histidine kinase [Halostella litorea]|uniref:sensor histidine kinase n=1 Tax=Halostella litorea TaxID=2528831 RepID=UPI00192A234F|nr:HAMP domain-containing sensor histidine kinase [Halostella litorea]
MGSETDRDPLVLLGVGILLGTTLAGAVAGVPLRVAAAQLSLPGVIGVGLVAYGRIHGEPSTADVRRTVFTWSGYGILVFVLVGFWFGQVTRYFETSFVLAVVASLSLGAGFGATVGVYSVRLQRTNAELESKNEQMDRFASVVSHDLRNPLNVATGYLALAAEERDDDDHVVAASESLDRMDALIDDLLLLAREGDPVGELEPVALETLCVQCWDAVETNDATLSVDTTRTVRADRSRLRQLFENLFRNAVEHGSPGDSHARRGGLTVTVGDLADGFYVADDGPGIPDRIRENAFDEGVSGSETGTGLGLSIVAQVAEGHGWDVHIAESADGGARIEVTSVEFV